MSDYFKLGYNTMEHQINEKGLLYARNSLKKKLNHIPSESKHAQFIKGQANAIRATGMRL